MYSFIIDFAAYAISTSGADLANKTLHMGEEHGEQGSFGLLDSGAISLPCTYRSVLVSLPKVFVAAPHVGVLWRREKKSLKVPRRNPPGLPV